VLSPLQPFADLPEGLRVNWHRGPVMSPSGLHAAGADRARVVLIDNDADSHTLMTVLRLEKITGGSVFTVAAYDEPGFDSLLMSAGCDFAINEDELAGPVLVQAGSNNGYGELLEAMISQDGSTQSVFCRVLGEGWSSQPWGDARTMLKQEHGVVALGLISEDGKQLTTWPKRDQAAAPGQRLLFLAQGDADLPTFLGA
jgi:hypothetical protein